jgi:hypothetical protein
VRRSIALRHFQFFAASCKRADQATACFVVDLDTLCPLFAIWPEKGEHRVE